MVKTKIIAAAVLLALWGSGGARAAAPPSNDTIQDATVVPSIPYSTPADVYDATASSTDPTNCFNSETLLNTVWYQYTATGTASLDVTATSSADTDGAKYLALYSGTPGALTFVACQQIDSYYQEDTIRFVPTVGTSYYVLIGAFEPVASGDQFEFSMKDSPAPNSGAISVSSQTTYYNKILYDVEGGFYAQTYLVVSGSLTCTGTIDNISLNITVNQGSSSVYNTGQNLVNCVNGTGKFSVTLAPYSFATFSPGAATVNVNATMFDANYSASVTAAPTTLVRQKVGNGP